MGGTNSSTINTSDINMVLSGAISDVMSTYMVTDESSGVTSVSCKYIIGSTINISNITSSTFQGLDSKTITAANQDSSVTAQLQAKIESDIKSKVTGLGLGKSENQTTNDSITSIVADLAKAITDTSNYDAISSDQAVNVTCLIMQGSSVIIDNVNLTTNQQLMAAGLLQSSQVQTLSAKLSSEISATQSSKKTSLLAIIFIAIIVCVIGIIGVIAVIGGLAVIG